jgi:hypothetical protein
MHSSGVKMGFILLACMPIRQVLKDQQKENDCFLLCRASTSDLPHIDCYLLDRQPHVA